MESIDRSALVPYTTGEMFALVSDVDAYPEFLPWCSAAQILAKEGDEVTARIDFAVSGVSKSFTTRNQHVSDHRIDMRLVEGPFSDLQGYWQFDPLGDAGCRISLSLKYDFSSRIVKMVVGPVFGQIANTLVDAFQQRAAQVYGER
ncbi:MAG TPA: type II toxin-antitoxin system RatA family toxin [Gammaproteobacteria bacterium]|nr:type II toxin-antitoxin system RatA family toxin [Gammaproteobacteria bacterium]